MRGVQRGGPAGRVVSGPGVPKPRLRPISIHLPGAGELRCRCLQTVSEVIPPRRLARLELVPEGPHCAVPEVIATTKRGQTICLNPAAPWVKLMVSRVLSSSRNQL
ncbi:permeability factor 2-like isoform X1 [Heliangelus exortis]|uniref:permeability factor 2-like isoform X1 n=1 Tax=Heliangelus exortis TaxID=472823 RepID=UPI003A92C475